MKKLHKKIGAMALAGMIVAGGVGVSGVRVFAADGKKVEISEEDQKKYKSNKYPDLENYSKYANKYEGNSKISLKGSDEGIDKLEKVLNKGKFLGIRYSGEYDVIDDFLDGLNIEKLQKPQVIFQSVDSFEKYVEEIENGKIKVANGFYRLVIEGYDGIFRVGPRQNIM